MGTAELTPNLHIGATLKKKSEGEKGQGTKSQTSRELNGRPRDDAFIQDLGPTESRRDKVKEIEIKSFKRCNISISRKTQANKFVRPLLSFISSRAHLGGVSTGRCYENIDSRLDKTLLSLYHII